MPSDMKWQPQRHGLIPNGDNRHIGYAAWNAARKLPSIRVALILAAVIFLLSMLGDPGFPDAFPADTTVARIIAAAVFLAVLGASYLPWIATHPGLMVLGSLTLASGISGYLSGHFGVDGAFRVVATHFAFAIFAITLAPSFRTILMAAIILFVVPNAATWFFDGPLGTNLGAEVVLFFGLVAVAVLGFLIDRERRLVYAMSLELERAAITDELTGIANRRYALALAEREVARAQRLDHPLCCLVLDIDRFKRINDQHGHHIGDIVLRGMAEAASAQVRKIDTFGRTGGEEFLIILPDTDHETGLVIADRLRRLVSELAIVAGGTTIWVTVSIGLANLLGEDDTVEALLRRADKALYEAKDAGRNRVEAA
jgi:diguanylate cyclase (GGDEF)-like protein